jgi:hypothetical protein
VARISCKMARRGLHAVVLLLFLKSASGRLPPRPGFRFLAVAFPGPLQQTC